MTSGVMQKGAQHATKQTTTASVSLMVFIFAFVIRLLFERRKGINWQQGGVRACNSTPARLVLSGELAVAVVVFWFK